MRKKNERRRQWPWWCWWHWFIQRERRRWKKWNWIKSSLEWQNRMQDFKAKCTSGIIYDIEYLLNCYFLSHITHHRTGYAWSALSANTRTAEKTAVESIKIRVAFIYVNLYHHIMRSGSLFSLSFSPISRFDRIIHLEHMYMLQLTQILIYIDRITEGKKREKILYKNSHKFCFVSISMALFCIRILILEKLQRPR